MSVMPRLVEPEWLDALAPRDPRAVASRRDLRTVNAIMGHAGRLAKTLPALVAPPRCIVELGAGDGSWTASLARALPENWSAVKIVLLDRQDTVAHAALSDLARRGWHAEVVTADARDWLDSAHEPIDLVVVNLFLHHFEGPELRTLLARIASRARAFAACEPRRCAGAVRLARLLAVIGCNAVTRHDAAVSVRAGFTARELTALWPAAGEWTLHERDCGWLTHLFVAVRVARPGGR